MFLMCNLVKFMIACLMLDQVTGLSFNQPTFRSLAAWNPNATTFANNNTISPLPQVIFINTDNNIYLAEMNLNGVQIWLNGSMTPSKTITTGINSPQGLFVATDGDVYIDNGFYNSHVQKWTLSATIGVIVMNVTGSCYGLFVDINDTLYCSIGSQHQVLKVSLNSNGTTPTIAAGTGTNGSASNMLNNPQGLFVDRYLNLHVAECGNNRIQLFRSGQLNGSTLAGNGAPGTITLNCPTGIMLDADGYLFIVEFYGHRIVGSGPSGYRCIIGCAGSGSSASQLSYPYSFSFDTYGNILVSDQGNQRIQNFSLATNSSGPNYNQPRFSSCATWNLNAVTFANDSLVGVNPYGVFIDIHNTVYITNKVNSYVQIWLEGNMVPVRNLSGGIISPRGIFVTVNGDIYVDNGNSDGRVEKWSLNATNGTTVMYVNGSCWGLFVDIYDNIYCSVPGSHRVIKRSFNDSDDTTSIVAGTGTAGSTSDMLNSSRGIFVDVRFNLYVADSANHRIQLFPSDQLNGTTVAGNGSSGTITLNYPTGVVLDADGYLFISDTNNNRIVGSGPSGFRCIVGCLGTNGVGSNQLNSPWGLAFDSYGNLFVTDEYNNRTQQFFLATNSCGLSFNQPKFSPCATWNPNATTIANVSLVGASPHDVFIDINNTVYVADQFNSRVQIWSGENITFTKTISNGLNSPRSIFIAHNGDLYIDNSVSNQRIDKWTLNATASVPVMYITGICYGLFIDIDDNLYCSSDGLHQVIKHSLYSGANTSIIVAGTGTAGSASNMLNGSRGIFVDTNLTLYVADCWNNRIQYFQSGQLNGTTMSINGSNGTLTLNCPTGIVFDTDRFSYITDYSTNRILGSGPGGFRCIVGCTGVAGPASDQLDRPHSLSFDSYGNLFVIEYGNERLQKFSLSSNSCDSTTTNLIDTTVAETTTQLQQEQTSIVTTAVPTSTSSTSVAYNQSCFPPGITLIPSTSSFSSPMVFRRNQDFYISSYIVLRCNTSLSTITQWTIYICNSSNCFFAISIDSAVARGYSELYIPARSLQYGMYRLDLRVTMSTSSNLTSSSSAYVEIGVSSMTSNLVEYGTSMITSGYKQDLIFDPGRYSIYSDGSIFNATEWKYKYYCRIYGISEYPNLNGSELSIDDPRIDSFNPSCLSNRTGWRFLNSIQSSLMIVGSSLLSNRTYQFMIRMKNVENSSVQSTGYLLVKIVDQNSEMIVIGCIISSLCIPNQQFQVVNPTSQVSLFSVCIGNCSSIKNIQWNIYQGFNASLSTVQWNLFNQTDQYDDIWFFGRNTSNLTVLKELFLDHRDVSYWRLEVIYSFMLEKSSSALNIVLNQSPQNGSCSINPLNGTTITLFTISCLDWFDEDGIKDYSLYSYEKDSPDRMIIAFSSSPEFEVRLPCGNEHTSEINLVIEIRDRFDCITDLNITSVVVTTDVSSLSELLHSFENSNESLTNNRLVQLLSSGNQNLVGQILTSLSQQFNQMSKEALGKVVSNGISPSTIFVSSLESETSDTITASMNASALNEYLKEQNSYANLRDYLMRFTTNLLISTSTSIKLQASSLVQLTKTTNQLTRSAALIASDRCYQLAQSLYSMSRSIPYEDVQSATNELIQCTSNLMTAINGPLQGRTKVLNLDDIRANTFPEDYDTDLESPWSNIKLIGNRNIYYQKQMADQIDDQTKKTISFLSNALKIHLNVGQNQIINTSSVFLSLETMTIESLSNKILQPMVNARVDLRSNINSTITTNQSVSLRLIVQPLALADQSGSQSNTNLSRSITFSLLDENGNEISLSGGISYRLMIPRDPNLQIPPMTLQNVTSMNSTPHHLLFNLHFVNLIRSNDLSISVHIEMKSLNFSIAYLFIYKFDSSPRLNSSINQIDGWSLFCPSNVSDENIYKYFLDNEVTEGHQSLIFGVRELNSTEVQHFCSNGSMNESVPITDYAFHFTSNYEIRVYTSGCYYLNENNQWKSDGLKVGSMTNVNETECYSIEK